MDSLTKQEIKLRKDQGKEFKKKFKAVRTKIRRIKTLKRQDKKVLILDLGKVNGDLMSVLFYDKDPWLDVSDYFDTINAYLKSERITYKYKVPGYLPSKMAEIMEVIRTHHNNMDRLSELRTKLGINAI